MPCSMKCVNLSFNIEQYKELTDLAIAENVTVYTFCKKIICEQLSKKIPNKKESISKNVVENILCGDRK